MSSYIFLICIEGLSALMKESDSQNIVSGIKVARTAPSISHMFFTDDAYIFSKADITSAENVLTLLKLFKQASRQKINVDKSSIFFSKNTQDQLKKDLSQRLGFKEAADNSHYLGLPYIVGRNKSVLFGFIKEVGGSY